MACYFGGGDECKTWASFHGGSTDGADGGGQVLFVLHETLANEDGDGALSALFQFGQLLGHVPLQVPVGFPRGQVRDLLFN